MIYDLIVVGGGASGFFAAIQAAEMHHTPKILILEKSKDVLSKVRISGGGRCNLTHSDFIPHSFVKNYPRGERELLGPFHRFMSSEVMQWFENKGVALKTENDGRVFPSSNTSQTIIDCFLNEVKKHRISLHTQEGLTHISKNIDLNAWVLNTSKQQTYLSKNVIIATGSSHKIWALLQNLGHKIIPPVASLFSFCTENKDITSLSGISTTAHIQICEKNNNKTYTQQGAVLITHWGFSGPAILKLSSVAARFLHERNYTFSIKINWAHHLSKQELFHQLELCKHNLSKKNMGNTPFENIPKKLWHYLLNSAHIPLESKWGNLPKKHISALNEVISSSVFQIKGKATFKEEFVTAGGVCLKEIDFKTFESRLFKNIYIVGEALDIDAVTGGFNFQNAWTSAYIAATSIEV